MIILKEINNNKRICIPAYTRSTIYDIRYTIYDIRYTQNIWTAYKKIYDIRKVRTLYFVYRTSYKKYTRIYILKYTRRFIRYTQYHKVGFPRGSHIFSRPGPLTKSLCALWRSGLICVALYCLLCVCVSSMC